MKVKICGLTRREDAAFAAECGADYLGVVFEPGTPRCVTPEQAASILSGLSPLKVAVFGTLRDLGDWSLFDAVQFRSDPHGVEASLPGHLQIIRGHNIEAVEVALPPGEEGVPRLGGEGGRTPSASLRLPPPPPATRQVEELSPSPREGEVREQSERGGGNASRRDAESLRDLRELIHVDALVPGHSGGTGVLADWAAAALIEGRVMLAGGLTPGNVAEAILAVRPYAVDTSSGVEKETKGVKDHALIEAFIRSAKLSSV